MAAVWQSACNQHAISMQSEVTRVPAAAPQRAMPKSSLIWLIQVLFGPNPALFGSSKSYLAQIQPYLAHRRAEAAPVVEQRIDLGHDHKASGTFG